MPANPVSDIEKYSTKTIQGDRILYFLETEDSENFDMCRKRAERVLSRIQRDHRSENVVLVAHGDTNK